MKRLLFIFNLHSGKGSIRNHLADIIDVFNQAGYETVVYSTQARGDATRIAQEKGAQFDLIVCSGGDGTLSEVLDGIMQLEEARRPRVGYIPAGSTNDYAFSLGLSSHMKKCARMITEENFKAVDIGKFESDYFVYVAAFGAFTEVSWNTPQKTKNALGHNAYILEGIRQFSGLKSYRVKFIFDGEELLGDCIYAMVYNSFSVGGLKHIGSGEVQLDDGKLNMMVIYTPENAVDFSVLIADLMTKNPNSRFIANYEITDVTIESETEIEWVLDGEYGGSHKIVHIETVPHGMQIAVPGDGQPELPESELEFDQEEEQVISDVKK